MITLIMPAYNEGQNISASILSIREQTVKDFQLIIVNDGSTDNTVEVVEQSIEGDDRIKFINPDHKVGKNGAINLASQYMKGEWLYFMGADDILPSNALETWENAVKEYDPNKCVAIRGRLRVFSDSHKYNNLVLPKNGKRENFSGPLTLQSKGLLKYSLPIPEGFPNEDTWWGLCIQTFAEEKKCIDDIIVNYRIHEGNSISRRSSFEVFTEKYHVRYIIREPFLEKFGKLMTSEQIDEMKRELKLEDLRWHGKTFSILLLSGFPLITKLRAAVFSNRFLYKIKIKSDRFFLGH